MYYICSMKIETSILITIKNYALRERVTTSYIYKLIKEGKMNSLDIDGVQFIDLKKFATLPVINRRK